MKYPKEYLDEIKTRLKVSTVVSKSVVLKKRGKEFVGLSPFKNEKTPSFTVNDEKGFYHCFSTSEHGNIFDFLMKTQNLKFGEAVKALANQAGMQQYIFSKADQEKENKRKEYLEIYLNYINHYHNELIKNQKFVEIKNYLKKRQLTIQEVTNFKIGYVDRNINIYDNLKKKHSEEILNETGLFYFDEKNKYFVERFRGRIIFPINDISGNPIALGGRTIDSSKYIAKYINSPETLFFKKGSNLYNLDKARKLSNKNDQIFLVEGYMDVIGLNRIGIENVVANLGTSLTERQIIIINQFFEHLIICFDGDESGFKAAVRAAENSIINLQPDKKISFLFLPQNEDPDSFASKIGKKDFEQYSKDHIVPIHKFIFEHYKNQSDNSPSSLAIFEKKLKNLSNTIKDKIIGKYVLEYFLERISSFTPHSQKKGTFKRVIKAKTLDKTKKHFQDTLSLTQIEIKEFSFLYLILENVKLLELKNELIKNVKIYSQENKLVFDEILSKFEKGETIGKNDLNLDKQLIERIYKFASVKHIVENNKNDVQKMTEILEEIAKDLKYFELELRIQDLESKFSKDFSENTFNEINELKKLQKFN